MWGVLNQILTFIVFNVIVERRNPLTVWSVLLSRNSVSKRGKKMTKDISTLSAIKTEAMIHFSFILRQLGCEGGHFGPLKVHPAYDGNIEGTKRVRLRTKFGEQAIEGIVVLRNEDDQWRLYCAASDIDFGDWHASFAYDKETRTYHITKFYKGGGCEPMTVNMVTGERTVFADPADEPVRM